MNYTGFSVTWNETLVGVTVEAPCTGSGLNGNIITINLQNKNRGILLKFISNIMCFHHHNVCTSRYCTEKMQR